LAFEPNSKLTQIGKFPFDGCRALNFICIPQSVGELQKDWCFGTSLCSEAFESGASLLKMIEMNQVDLEGCFDVSICDWDRVMHFPGYSVFVICGDDNSLFRQFSSFLSDLNKKKRETADHACILFSLSAPVHMPDDESK
jgi:hypothetical protein